MAVIYDTTLVKTPRMQAVIDAIDNGVGAGSLEIQDASNNVLAVFPLSEPCGTAVNGVLTFSDFPKHDVDADATGTPAKARIKNGTGTVIITGLTVGLSAADIILESLDIQIGQTVSLLNTPPPTLTHAA